MVRLRKHQAGGVATLNSHFETENTGLMVMASGLGKTITVGAWLNSMPEYCKVLYLCHQTEILEQAMGEFALVCPDANTALFQGSKRKPRDVDVIFVTFQMLVVGKNRRRFRRDEFDIIIVDEGHHSAADTYAMVLKYFEPEILLGMTATPDRADLRSIRKIFGPEVIDIPLEVAIHERLLSRVEYHLLSDGISNARMRAITASMMGRKKGSRRVSVKQLNETIFVRQRDRVIARKIMVHKGKTIIFCEGIKHADYMQRFIPRSRVYHSRLTKSESVEVLRAFRNGRLRHILVVDKFNEGIDIPQAEVLVFLRCTNSQTIFLQQLGRGLRKTAGKKKVVVLDFVANYQRVQMISDFMTRLGSLAQAKEELVQDVMVVSGKGFKFVFSDKTMKLLKVLERIRMRFVCDIPKLMREYSPRNSLPPHMVAAGTNRRLKWVCETCGHRWISTGSNRYSLGRGCPACAGQVATVKHNLAVCSPSIADEYMAPPHNKLPVYQIRPGSGRLVKWLCRKCEHIWVAAPYKRVNRGQGCPECYRKSRKQKKKS